MNRLSEHGARGVARHRVRGEGGPGLAEEAEHGEPRVAQHKAGQLLGRVHVIEVCRSGRYLTVIVEAW